MAPNTHWARILDTPHEYSDRSSTHGAACNDPTMTSGGDQQLISGKLSRYFDEESRCSNMSSCSMHALTLRMMSFLTVRALSPRLGARGTNVRARRVGGARPGTWQAISTLKTTNAGPQGPQRHRSRSSGYCRSRPGCLFWLERNVTELTERRKGHGLPRLPRLPGVHGSFRGGRPWPQPTGDRNLLWG